MMDLSQSDIERLLRLHSEQTTDQASFVFDRDGTIVWCNPTAARIFGCAAADLIGQPAHRLFTPDDIEDGVPDFELCVASQSTDMNNDRWLQRINGSTFWASGSTTAIHDEKGEFIAFVKTLRNRTDVKEQIETLRNRVETLRRADENKDIFLSTLSHELRNPLVPLANALQLIRMTAVAQDQALQYPIKLIERQVEFIRRLVDDLLDVTRISTGKIQLTLSPVDLRDVLASAVESTRPLMTQRRHTLVQHILDTPLVVPGDAGRLEQVFMNLLSNAAKYTPESGRIEIRASLDQQDATVHIFDNGVGIAKDMQPRIFELFTQVDQSIEQSQGGLGIGLSLVKNFVELHGGSVQVRSEGSGKGSEFTVRLPLAQR